MRTTISLDDDVFQIAKDYAETRSVALGKAVSELVRRGWQTPVPTRIVNGLHVLVLPPDAPQMTTEQIKKLESDWE
jgi:hypothetical protein